MGGPQIWVPKRTIATQDPQPFYAIHNQTGELRGPFDPGVVSFRDPVGLDRWHQNELTKAADALLEAAAKGGRRGLDRALRRRFMGDPRGIAAPSTQHQYLRRVLYGVSGGAIVKAFLGDGGAATFDGFDVNSADNGTNPAGQAGGAGSANKAGRWGSGAGKGEAGDGGFGDDGGGGGGGGYGTAGTAGGAGGFQGGNGGQVISADHIWAALRAASFVAATLEYGAGGGGGGGDTGGSAGTGAAGGTGGAAYIEVVLGLLTTVARALAGVAGGNGAGDVGGGGGGGAGGLSLLIAYIIAYGADTIAVDGGAGGTSTGGTGVGGVGGDGRVIQLYFEAFEASLTVTGAQEDQFQILRSPTPGLAVAA